LPNSGLIVRFPGEMGLNPDGTVNEEVKTIPDVYVEQPGKIFRSGSGERISGLPLTKEWNMI